MKLNSLFLNRRFLVLVFACLFVGQQNLNGEVTGYVYEQVSVNATRQKDTQILNHIRLLTTKKWQPSESLEIGASLVADAYGGRRFIDVTQYLPKAEAEKLPPLTRKGFIHTFDDGIWLQELYVALQRQWGELRVGRQRFFQGTGYAFNPTDLVNKKDLFGDGEEVSGVDALRIEKNIGSETQLQFFYSFGSYHESERLYLRPSDGDLVLRLKSFLKGWDYTASLVQARLPRFDVLSKIDGLMTDFEAHAQLLARMAAFEFSGSLFEFGLHGEGGYVAIEQPNQPYQLAADLVNHWRGLLGVDYTFDWQLQVLVEYMYLGNSHGAARYYTLNERLGMLSGERTMLGFDTAVLSLRYPLSDTLTTQIVTIANLNDKSLLIHPKLAWEFDEDVTFTMQGRLFQGDAEAQVGRAAWTAVLRLKAFF